MSVGTSPTEEEEHSRKGSEATAETSVVDAEIEEMINTWRLSNPQADRISEMKEVVGYCKRRLQDAVSDSMPRCVKEAYMERIVQLGLEKQRAEDDVTSAIAMVRVKGHDFALQSIRGRHNPYCEVCKHTIWRLVQSWRRCEGCGLRTHDKCAMGVNRRCASIDISRKDFQINTVICAEIGLAAQGYCCAECKAPLAYEGSYCMEPKLCDYSGLLYCMNCHWDDKWTIPARLLTNWDASARPVSRAAKQLLALIDSKPIIDIKGLHPLVIKFHKELKRVCVLRRNFLYMKCYFVSCRNARKLRILQYLNQHQHFVEGSDMYTLKELRELCEGTLLHTLEDIHTVFRKHIEEECETCKGKAFFCELCNDPKTKNQLLFPFTEDSSICPECLAVFHTRCFERRSSHCPRCERRKQRTPLIMRFTDESADEK